MKTNPFINLTAGLAVILGTPALAIEAPADNAPPPAAVPSAPAAKPAPAKPAAQEPGAFLGVVSSELPAMLAEHLGLKAGEGIVVQALMPDGPAAKAGVAVHDVITRVADQRVASPLDLTNQVAGRQPGDKIHLEVIHQGKPAGLDVTLGTRPEGMAALNPVQPPDPLGELKLEEMNLPKDLAARIRAMIEGNLEGGAADLAPKIQQDALREMQKHMAEAKEGLKVPGAAGGPGIHIQQGATIRLMDEQGSVELKVNDGSKEVTIRGKDDKITWTGPWDTEQDKAAAPEDIRQRIDRLNLNSKFQGNGIQLQLQGNLHGGAGVPPPEPDDNGD